MDIEELFENSDDERQPPPSVVLGKRPIDIAATEAGNDRVQGVKASKMEASEPVKRKPAKEYKFQLDTFQQTAVDYIDRGESVLVAAHTSAGKTAVAEYAIATSLRDKQRVIYTSPIKALSNQKYRDLQEEFQDVGLMTGDMTINPNATCLIMTTEILRSMLYRGSEVMREVAWVIYDEVHYMRDKERGVVWEESIILLPHKVRFVFLSATIPNAPEFVGWITKLHHQPCHVVYTDYRPVPLRHFLFPAGAEGLFLVVDEKGKFKEENFQKAMSNLQADDPSASNNGDRKQSKKQGNSQKPDLFKIVKLIMDRQLDPCIVFSFSKKDCETFALQMSRMDFNSDDEKELVQEVFMNAIEGLSEDDKELPQVCTILPLLKKGIGIHHGGLLPILKEVIEILFQEGLIKCLFATETFSIGINMPAKTVVFTNTRKFDGSDFRWITSGEYIQMSGRAGRRGKDDQGLVIQMLDEKMEPDIAKNMIYGSSDPLYSSYHVSYNMVLNMLRVEDANPENLIRSSFLQYQQEQSAPELERQADEFLREADLIRIDNEESVQDYHSASTLLDRTKTEISTIVTKLSNCQIYLEAGRMVRICYGGIHWGWGVVVRFRPAAGARTDIQLDKLIGVNSGIEGKLDLKCLDSVEYVVDMLLEVLPCTADSNDFQSHLSVRPCCELGDDDTAAKVEMIHVACTAILDFSAIKLNMPKDLTREVNRLGVLKALKEIPRRFVAEGKKIPMIDPLEDMNIKHEALQPLIERCTALQERLDASPLNKMPDQATVLSDFRAKVELQEKAQVIRAKARESQVVVMRDQLKKMKRVLRKFEYISEDNVLCLKGKFSCELSTGDELVLTNMIFDGIFSDLSIDQSVALLSCFVHKEQTKASAPPVRKDMQPAIRQLQGMARTVAGILLANQLITDEDDYVATFNPGVVDVAFAWAAGSKFSEICKLTDIFEGNLIRILRRLEELMRQLAAAALAIGNSELKTLFEEGSKKIRRGVVFAASLYV